MGDFNRLKNFVGPIIEIEIIKSLIFMYYDIKLGCIKYIMCNVCFVRGLMYIYFGNHHICESLLLTCTHWLIGNKHK